MLVENVLEKLDAAWPDTPRIEVVYDACREVGGAVLTAILTTVTGFLPVFFMVGQEGKLFRPLAFTKTFVLIASIVVALTLLPPLAHLLLGRRGTRGWKLPAGLAKWGRIGVSLAAALGVTWLLSQNWRPLGLGRGDLINFVFVVLLVGGLLLGFHLFQLAYPFILRWTLRHKVLFLSVPVALVVLGLCVWLGFARVFFFAPASGGEHEDLPRRRRRLPRPRGGVHAFARRGQLPLHAHHDAPRVDGHRARMLKTLDAAIADIPEVSMVVGKIGRAETPLDPAPISMIETVVHYHDEFRTDDEGNRVRVWRDHIQSPEDIWNEIEKVTDVPGVTGAPLLQPIETRLVMLQTGMRSPIGVKVRGPDLATIESFGFTLEELLRQTPGINPTTVNADRIVGTPYLEIDIDRDAIARYGLNVADVQRTIEVAVGGRPVTTTVEGRERFAVRVRYLRELRDDVEALRKVVVASADGSQQVPLGELADIRFERGPRMIRSEDTFLTGRVTFGSAEGYTDVQAVASARAAIDEAISRVSFACRRGSATRSPGGSRARSARRRRSRSCCRCRWRSS